MVLSLGYLVRFLENSLNGIIQELIHKSIIDFLKPIKIYSFIGNNNLSALNTA